MPRRALNTIWFASFLAAVPAAIRAQPAVRATGTSPVPISASQPANLVHNGDFEIADSKTKLPSGWTTKHPQNVRLIDVGGTHGHVIELTGDKKLMGTYGVDLTGEKIPVQPNTRYRCTGYTQSAGPKMIVFVKGYATLTKKVGGRSQIGEEEVYRMRKEIAASPDWQAFNLDFEIKPVSEFSDFQHKIEYLRITLWADWPAGTCKYDDIKFEEAGPIPTRERLHSEAVTHVGVRPRLAVDSRPASSQPAAIDEEQTWLDASNAWREEQYDKALRLTDQLLLRSPGRGDYHLLAARTLTRLKRWPEADQHAQWLLSAPTSQPSSHSPKAARVEPWQQEWAQVVRGEVLMHTGKTTDARQILNQVQQSASSPHARAAAASLLNELDSPRKK
jgi:hypothetical protein